MQVPLHLARSDTSFSLVCARGDDSLGNSRVFVLLCWVEQSIGAMSGATSACMPFHTVRSLPSPEGGERNFGSRVAKPGASPFTLNAVENEVNTRLFSVVVARFKDGRGRLRTADE